MLAREKGGQEPLFRSPSPRPIRDKLARVPAPPKEEPIMAEEVLFLDGEEEAYLAEPVLPEDPDILIIE